MPVDRPVSRLVMEYEHLSGLYDAQPPLTRHFLEQQAAVLAESLDRNHGAVRYQLPDRLILEEGETVEIPPATRSRFSNRARGRKDRLLLLIRSLNHLEQSLNPALAACGLLLRYTLARHMLYQILPDGISVMYQAESGDDLPSIPVGVLQPSALLAGSDAVYGADESPVTQDRVQVPYVHTARRFFLPQWVAIGENDCVLVGSLKEAEATVVTLRNAVSILQEAVAVCPSLVADETYQRKRAGLLGQLINQGRALARAYTQEIIEKMHNRAAAGTLNRGLSLSLPYFNDSELALNTYQMEVIPTGRIMFIPAFVVLAMRKAEMHIRGDVRLTGSTRKHLLEQLKSIECAFSKRFPQ